ncbi:MAG: hypothetical protein FJ102_01110 [Deltaproteobacteria bacterium]|nr:hypothetical protein [Deltaproteobacteria bacterium]
MTALLALLLLACRAAWTPGGPGRFSVDPPQGWEVTRNYRWLGTDNLVLARDAAAISLTVQPSRGRARELPLGVLASVRALSWGRRLGVQSAILAEHEVLVDGRRGYAVTGVRRWRRELIGYTTVMVRTEARLVELTLFAPPALLDAQALAWQGVLESLRLHEPAPPTPIFVEEQWPP